MKYYVIICQPFRVKDALGDYFTIRQGTKGLVHYERRTRLITFDNNKGSITVPFKKNDGYVKAQIQESEEMELRASEILIPLRAKDFFNNRVRSLFKNKMHERHCMEAFHVMYTVDKERFLPPLLQTIYEPLLKFCIEHEYYELCEQLKRLVLTFRKYNLWRFREDAILKCVDGWGWLYALTKELDIVEKEVNHE